MEIKQVTTSMRQELADKIDVLAHRYHSSADEIISEAISYWVDLEEEKYQALLEGMADVRAGRVVSDEAVQAWIDSLDTDNPLPLPQSGK